MSEIVYSNDKRYKSSDCKKFEYSRWGEGREEVVGGGGGDTGGNDGPYQVFCVRIIFSLGSFRFTQYSGPMYEPRFRRGSFQS